MSPDVLARKLERIAEYLSVLEAHRGRSAQNLRDDPYEVERLLELLVQVATDIVAHLLAEGGATPSSYRGVFEEGGRRELLPTELADRLADAAGLRNVLVHMYEDIDYGIVAASIGRALEDFNEFLRIFQKRLEEESSGEGSGAG